MKVIINKFRKKSIEELEDGMKYEDDFDTDRYDPYHSGFYRKGKDPSVVPKNADKMKKAFDKAAKRYK